MRKLLLLFISILLQTGFVNGQAIIKSFDDRLFYNEVAELPLYIPLFDTLERNVLDYSFKKEQVLHHEVSVEKDGINNYIGELCLYGYEFDYDCEDETEKEYTVYHPEYPDGMLVKDDDYLVVYHKDSVLKYYSSLKYYQIDMPDDTLVRAYAFTYPNIKVGYYAYRFFSVDKTKHLALKELSEQYTNFIAQAENSRYAKNYYHFGPHYYQRESLNLNLDSAFNELINNPLLKGLDIEKAMLCDVYAAYFLANKKYGAYKEFVTAYKEFFKPNSKSAIHLLEYDFHSNQFLAQTPFPHSRELEDYLRLMNGIYLKRIVGYKQFMDLYTPVKEGPYYTLSEKLIELNHQFFLNPLAGGAIDYKNKKPFSAESIKAKYTVLITYPEYLKDELDPECIVSKMNFFTQDTIIDYNFYTLGYAFEPKKYKETKNIEGDTELFVKHQKRKDKNYQCCYEDAWIKNLTDVHDWKVFLYILDEEGKVIFINDLSHCIIHPTKIIGTKIAE